MERSDYLPLALLFGSWIGLANWCNTSPYRDPYYSKWSILLRSINKGFWYGVTLPISSSLFIIDMVNGEGVKHLTLETIYPPTLQRVPPGDLEEEADE